MTGALQLLVAQGPLAGKSSHGSPAVLYRLNFNKMRQRLEKSKDKEVKYSKVI